MEQKKNNEKFEIYGLTARFEDKDKLINALQRAVNNGYKKIEIYSPFPVEEAEKILQSKEPKIQWAVFFGGIFGGLGGFLMQYYASVIAYPLNIGGRPYNSWPAFVPIMFELTILFAALSGFTAFLISCRLPELNHPIFNIPLIERSGIDQFFLCIKSDDKNFDLRETKKFLEGTEDAVSVHEAVNDTE